jgi:hypothetical protein
MEKGWKVPVTSVHEDADVREDVSYDGCLGDLCFRYAGGERFVVVDPYPFSCSSDEVESRSSHDVMEVGITWKSRDTMRCLTSGR